MSYDDDDEDHLVYSYDYCAYALVNTELMIQIRPVYRNPDVQYGRTVPVWMCVHWKKNSNLRTCSS